MAFLSRTLLAVSLSLCFGCASRATLTVYSVPDGAYITEKGTNLPAGVAPSFFFYEPEVLYKNKIAGTPNCYLVKGVEARWVSGAVASVDTVRLCGAGNGNYTITLNREPSQPGLEKDLEFALKVQAVRAQQQQAQASSDAALASMFSAISSATQSNSLNCTTTQIGNSIRTNCR